MSSIAYGCKCVLVKGKRYHGVDFEKEHYITIRDFKNCAYYCQGEVPELHDEFFVAVEGLIAVYDGQNYFCSYSKSIIEISTKYCILKEFTDGRHNEGLGEIGTYFSERAKEEVRGEDIFQYW